MESPVSSAKKEKKKSSKKKEKSQKKEKKRKHEEDPNVDVKQVLAFKGEEGGEVKKTRVQHAKGEEVKKTRVQHAPRFFPISVVANPLADEEESKAIFALIGKAVKSNRVRRGVKEATKFLRKGETGIMVFAGDVEPLDVMSHMPILCEDKDVPYIFVKDIAHITYSSKSREELGMEAGLKRPTTCILIKEDSSYAAEFKKLRGSIKPPVPTY